MPFNEKFIVRSQYIPKPSRRRSGALANKIQFIVAHDTGNPGSTAAGNVKWYIDTCQTVPPNQTSSAHLFVDDKEIIECVPALTGTPEKAWHVLYSVPKDNELYGVNANDAAIGVEYCFGGGIDADKAYAKYVWVLAKLCFVFNLDPAKSIVGHFFLDPTRKTDPVTGLARSRRTYDGLLKDVVKEYNECTGTATTLPPDVEVQSGTVVTSVSLNMRSQPNTNGQVVQVVPPHTQIAYKGIVHNGQKVNNNPVWYMDANSNYFWSGGVIPVVGSTVPPPTPAALQPDLECIDFIKNKEGLVLHAYQDVAGVWTIGYGSISYEDGRRVKPGEVITQQRAAQLLAGEVKQKSRAVNAAIHDVVLNQHQYNALVSFTYNVGDAALLSSTLLKKVRANAADPTIRDAFLMWDKAHVDGVLKVVQGLHERRKEEGDMYFES